MRGVPVSGEGVMTDECTVRCEGVRGAPVSGERGVVCERAEGQC